MVDLEPVKSWNKLISRSLGTVLWVYHEEHVRKPCAKVGSISVVMPRRLWGVYVHTLGTVEFHHRFCNYRSKKHVSVCDKSQQHTFRWLNNGGQGPVIPKQGTAITRKS